MPGKARSAGNERELEVALPVGARRHANSVAVTEYKYLFRLDFLSRIKGLTGESVEVYVRCPFCPIPQRWVFNAAQRSDHRGNEGLQACHSERYRGPPMTLGNMRANGVRVLFVYCTNCLTRPPEPPVLRSDLVMRLFREGPFDERRRNPPRHSAGFQAVGQR